MLLRGFAAPIVIAQSTFEESPADTFVADYGPIIGFVLLIAFMLFGLFGVLAALKGRERSLEIAAIARREGWQYLPDHINGVNVELPFSSFQQGDGRGTGNLVRGVVGGHEVSAFDYWWYVEHDRRGYGAAADDGIDIATILGSTSHSDVELPNRRYSSITCAMADVPNVLPHLIVTHENAAIRLLGAVAGGGLKLESEEFNRRFFVQCDDRRFATAFLDAQMQDFMLGCEGKLTFEARGRYLLIASPTIDAKRTAALMGQVATYRRCVPPIIDDLFPPIILGGDR